MIHKLIATRIDQVINGFFRMSINHQKVMLRFILKLLPKKKILMLVKSTSEFPKQLTHKPKKKRKFSAKQLAAQRLFAKRSKAGTLR